MKNKPIPGNYVVSCCKPRVGENKEKETNKKKTAATAKPMWRFFHSSIRASTSAPRSCEPLTPDRFVASAMSTGQINPGFFSHNMIHNARLNKDFLHITYSVCENFTPRSLANPIRIWGFPKIGVPPVIIHFNGSFHEINHPAIGVPPFLETPHIPTKSRHHWDVPGVRQLALSIISYGCEATP